ncbi:hypothetical protein FNB79_11565 [Formosa sediminum]|uniref:Uncharacterized protein n=1 Tax=Formosa sediminum TaxID=2594004 RepID=A0A516GSU2_9FLAO|nr:hypothetical protein [Formosa sediminum]QDO94575.1 hypothetical protein FNB79_11565 [Formosa sediminum]
MKKTLLILCLAYNFLACNTAKQVEKAVYSGDYDYAITTAVDKLKNNKDKKSKQEFIVMLEDAFTKGEARDLNRINYLKMDGNPVHFQEIFDLYTTLNSRQEAIRPLLPLQINGKNVAFNFKDYNALTLAAKNNLSSYIYTSSVKLLASKNKSDIRMAYDNLVYLNEISPNYKNTYQLINDAERRGIDFILVTINNQTRQIIPSRLQQDLLNFDTYGLDKQWSVYHAQKVQNVNYDYAMQLNLKQINVSPERINQREIFRERKIIDGTTYKTDRKGNPVKDSLGNFIKEDKIIDINYRYIETVQSKEAHILANVVYTDLKTKQIIENFPIDSGFIFENIYAEYYRKNRYDQKDERALTKAELELLRNRPMAFPSNEQMIFDTGEDLKLKLKDIINSFDTY